MQPVSLTSLAPPSRLVEYCVLRFQSQFSSSAARDMSYKGQDLVFMGSSAECLLGPETPNPHISKPN